MTTVLIALMSIITSALILTACYHLYKLHLSQTAIINDLQNQLTALCSGTVNTDERLIIFERTLAQLKEQQGSLSSSLAPQHNYDHAIRLAKKGVASTQLVDSCNLSDEEAHLIERMHGDKEHGAMH
tara:strand:+ start:1135 stop:1515 length:381 start_codon:yes stop_codon:yes gene_type:complete